MKDRTVIIHIKQRILAPLPKSPPLQMWSHVKRVTQFKDSVQNDGKYFP